MVQVLPSPLSNSGLQDRMGGEGMDEGQEVTGRSVGPFNLRVVIPNFSNARSSPSCHSRLRFPAAANSARGDVSFATISCANSVVIWSAGTCPPD